MAMEKVSTLLMGNSEGGRASSYLAGVTGPAHHVGPALAAARHDVTGGVHGAGGVAAAACNTRTIQQA